MFAMTTFIGVFAACKKNDEPVTPDSNCNFVTMPPSRTGGYWLEHTVSGKRVYDAICEIRCLDGSGVCFKYYTWEQETERNIEKNSCLLLFPKDDNLEEVPYPIDEFLRVSDFSYDENTGSLKFKQIY